jgi:oligopeptidase B
MKPPVAKKIPNCIDVHGDRRVDEYSWLRERNNPEVIAYLESENAYTEAVMKQTETLQQRLYDELVGRIKETDESVPQKIDDYYYYSRTEEGKQYSIHCRKKGNLDAAEEVILNENELAHSHEYFNIGALKLSPDHRFLAYSIDTDGSESHTLYVIDLETRQLLDEPIPNTYYGVEWANDSRTIFYNTLDNKMRPHKLYRHRLGTPRQDDDMVYHEEEDAFFLRLTKTKSRRFILMSLGSNTTTEVWYLDANRPEGKFCLIHPRHHEIEYYVDHRGESFYILTNDNARNFKLVQAPVADPGKQNWSDIIPHRKNVKIDEIEAFENHLVLYERENGLKKIRVMDAAGASHYVKFSEPVYTYWSDDNPEYSTDVLRFNYTSLVTPRSVFDYDMNTRESVLKKRYEVPGGFDPGQYASERVFAAARDGTRIPISLVYRKGLEKDGSNPLFLYGYGAYGASIEPFFLSHRLSLLDRGFIFAIAHVRGGGEMGRRWYEQGKLLHKTNTFTDFIACANHLIRKKYASRGNIGAYGGSAGGLLVGGVVNTRPELFRCVVAHVPFVDVVNTMLDESVPLTVIEYEEWGNPNQKKYYEYMRSYSPYDNVRRGAYPHMLVTAGLNDPRVQYWEPAKWVAKLRAMKTDDHLLLLRTKMDEGHAGPSGRYAHLREVAFEYAFLLRCFGINE